MRPMSFAIVSIGVAAEVGLEGRFATDVGSVAANALPARPVGPTYWW